MSRRAARSVLEVGRLFPPCVARTAPLKWTRFSRRSVFSSGPDSVSRRSPRGSAPGVRVSPTPHALWRAADAHHRVGGSHRRWQAEITQRLQREIRRHIPTRFERVLSCLEGLGVTAAQAGVRWHGFLWIGALCGPPSGVAPASILPERIGRLKASLAPLAADAALTRPARSRESAIIGATRAVIDHVQGRPGLQFLPNGSPVLAC